jgi:hypothetical protein
MVPLGFAILVGLIWLCLQEVVWGLTKCSHP